MQVRAHSQVIHIGQELTTRLASVGLLTDELLLNGMVKWFCAGVTIFATEEWRLVFARLVKESVLKISIDSFAVEPDCLHMPAVVRAHSERD